MVTTACQGAAAYVACVIPGTAPASVDLDSGDQDANLVVQQVHMVRAAIICASVKMTHHVMLRTAAANANLATSDQRVLMPA